MKISLRFIVFLALILLSFQLYLKQNTTSTTLSNSSNIPMPEIPIPGPVKEPSIVPPIFPDNKTSIPIDKNETISIPPKPKDNKPHDLPEMEPPKPTDTKKPSENSTHPIDVKTPPQIDVKPSANSTHPIEVKTPPQNTSSSMKPQSPPSNSTSHGTTTVPKPPQKQTTQTCDRSKSPKSTLNFNVYDVITHVLLNGKVVSQGISQKEISDWAKTHTISLGLCEGDIIEIAGKNTLGKLIGMIATLHFKNQKGIEKIYNTGSNWMCDFKPAVVKGKYGSIKGWSPMPLIDSKAAFIWNNNAVQKKVEVTCSFKIPMN